MYNFLIMNTKLSSWLIIECFAFFANWGNVKCMESNPILSFIIVLGIKLWKNKTRQRYQHSRERQILVSKRGRKSWFSILMQLWRICQVPLSLFKLCFLWLMVILWNMPFCIVVFDPFLTLVYPLSNPPCQSVRSSVCLLVLWSCNISETVH